MRLAVNDKRRSPKWAAKRRAHLQLNPACALCGCVIRKRLNVHHIEPFHLRPDLELVDENLLTLCEKSDAPLVRGLNCHEWVGHSGNWSAINPRVRQWCTKFGPVIAQSRRESK